MAGLLAGVINAVAGGGSLLSFPALIYVGLPPLAANVSNIVGVWPGYLGTTLGYREELEGQRQRIVVLALPALLGGGTGAVLLLLTTPPSVFERVVPVLVIGASLLLAVQTLVTRWVQGLPGTAGAHRSPLLHVALFLAAVYGGYFGGALGVILLAVLAVFLTEHLSAPQRAQERPVPARQQRRPHRLRALRTGAVARRRGDRTRLPARRLPRRPRRAA